MPDVPHAYRFFPGRTRGEGFFLAALRKSDYNQSGVHSTEASTTRRKKKKEKCQTTIIPDECKKWITNSSYYIYKEIASEIIALPSDMEQLHIDLAKQLNILKSGITIATLKGRNIVPTHELTMSTALSAEAFPRCELTYTEALHYLHRESITLPSETPQGFVILTYQNTPLGFVKNLGNRANNLYPNEWRIRSGHLPETEVRVL